MTEKLIQNIKKKDLNKIELLAITPDMSEEEIFQNLLKLLKQQGIEVKEQ